MDDRRPFISRAEMIQARHSGWSGVKNGREDKVFLQGWDKQMVLGLIQKIK